MTDDHTATWQSILTTFLAPALVFRPFAMNSADPVLLIGLGVGLTLTAGLFLWTGLLRFAVRARSSVTYVQLLRGLGFSLLGLVIPLLVLGLAMQVSRPFGTAAGAIIGGIWAFTMQVQALRELAGASLLRVFVTVLAGLFGVSVVAVGAFLVIFALTFGDPCGTTGPCLETSQSHNGVVVLASDNPMVRIPFEASFSEFALTEGLPGVEIRNWYTWAGVESPPDRPDIAFETALGEYQVTQTEDRCLEVCRGSGELVLQWPPEVEAGSLVVEWGLKAVVSFDTEPKGDDPMLSVDAPPSPQLVQRFVGGYGDEQNHALSAARLTVTELSGESGYLHLGWLDRGSDRADQEQIVRWATGEKTLRPGLAVEIPITDLCRPDCTVDMIASWIAQPVGRTTASAENPRPITAGAWVLIGEPIENFSIEHVPIPSVHSPTVERSVELDAGETRQVRMVITSPLATAAPQPVGLITAEVHAHGFSSDDPYGEATLSIGDSQLRLNPRADQTTAPHYQTPIPLTCGIDGCMNETTVSLQSTAKHPMTIEMSITVEVLHPEFDTGTIDLDLEEDQ